MRRATTPRHDRPAGAGEPSARAAGPRPDIQLAWARDRDGRKVHVAMVDPRDRHARAPFACLGCGDPVVPRLGQVRARHFAHHPGSRCPLTSPETALHLNAKERLLWLCGEAFAARLAVTLLTRCPACRSAAPRDLGALGDAARAEGAVGALRADVLVLAGDRPALAIEVKVTHAVDPEKEATLAAAGVPAVEIDAREAWERADGGAASSVLVSRTLGFPPCPACAAQARADGDLAQGGERAAIAELERLRARGLLAQAPLGAPDPVGGHAAIRAAERAPIARRFRCPECLGTALLPGERLIRHACPGEEARPVAWRGYDGALVVLAWWQPGGRT